MDLLPGWKGLVCDSTPRSPHPSPSAPIPAPQPAPLRWQFLFLPRPWTEPAPIPARCGDKTHNQILRKGRGPATCRLDPEGDVCSLILWSCALWGPRPGVEMLVLPCLRQCDFQTSREENVRWLSCGGPPTLDTVRGHVSPPDLYAAALSPSASARDLTWRWGSSQRWLR